jgi:hypothetical protein
MDDEWGTEGWIAAGKVRLREVTQPGCCDGRDQLPRRSQSMSLSRRKLDRFMRKVSKKIQ